MIDFEEQKVKDCLKDYLIARGYNLHKNFRCPNPEHNDKNPSAKYYENSNLVYCNGCHKHYDIFNLIGFEYGLNSKEAYKKGFELFGDKTLTNKRYLEKKEEEKEEINFCEKFIKWHKDLLESECAKKYIYSRGISDKTIGRFNLGFNQTTNYVVFPTSDYSFNSRSIKEKSFFKQGTSNLFNKSALFNDKRYCIITESEFDCLSFEEIGYNAIGLGGVGLFKKLFEENLPKDKVYILALDNDKAGQETTAEMINKFKQQDLMFLAMNYGELNKDPNEALTTNLDRFKEVCEQTIKNLEENKIVIENKEVNVLEEYKKLNTANMMKKFEEYVNKTKDITPYATGFKELDILLDGGLKEGLTTLLAVPGIGKTTLCLQIADNVAKSGKDVLIFALEMSRNELISKSLSRLSYEIETRRAGQFQDSNTFLYGYKQKLLNENILDYMNKCKEEYKKFAEHIYIDESNADMTIENIKERVRHHLKTTGNLPLVIIDYAQIITPMKDNTSDKQNLDRTILELKRLTRELGLAVLCISSVNRNSYDECIGMSSAKESGGIEFTSTVLLGLQYKATKSKDNKYIVNLEQEGQKDIKEVELKIIKNRFGKAYKTVNMKFNSELNYFEECPNAFSGRNIF